MKAKLAALLPLILAIGACAQSERVQADPDEVEAAVERANDQAAAAAEDRRGG